MRNGTSRRSFLIGIGAALAAPAIVRAESIMKVAKLRETINRQPLVVHSGQLFEGTIVRGTWEQLEGGRFNYRYDHPTGEHGIWMQCGRNHDFQTMRRILDMCHVTPYAEVAP